MGLSSCLLDYYYYRDSTANIGNCYLLQKKQPSASEGYGLLFKGTARHSHYRGEWCQGGLDTFWDLIQRLYSTLDLTRLL